MSTKVRKQATTQIRAVLNSYNQKEMVLVKSSEFKKQDLIVEKQTYRGPATIVQSQIKKTIINHDLLRKITAVERLKRRY